MKCKKIMRTLPAYLDDELGASRKAAIEKHLSVCAFCSNELKALVKTYEMMGAWDDAEPRIEIADTVVAHLRREQELKEADIGERSFFSQIAFRTAPAAVGIILILIGLLLMLRNPQTGLTPIVTHQQSMLPGSEADVPDLVTFIGNMERDMHDLDMTPSESALILDSFADSGAFGVRPIPVMLENQPRPSRRPRVVIHLVNQ
ncbi:MAG: zf-HC2 domain-containing protein [Thermoplasmata archaeon]|nr:zf-HC2 domain-containing protein [Thermoplasmata archaeon]